MRNPEWEPEWKFWATAVICVLAFVIPLIFRTYESILASVFLVVISVFLINPGGSEGGYS